MNRIRIIQKLNRVRSWLDSASYLEKLSDGARQPFSSNTLVTKIIDPYRPSLPYLRAESVKGHLYFQLSTKDSVDGLQYWLMVNVGGFHIPLGRHFAVPVESALFMLGSLSMLNLNAKQGTVSCYLNQYTGAPQIVYNTLVPGWRLWNPRYFCELFQAINKDTNEYLLKLQELATEEFKNSISLADELEPSDIYYEDGEEEDPAEP